MNSDPNSSSQSPSAPAATSPPVAGDDATQAAKPRWRDGEDWLAIFLGAILLLVAAVGVNRGWPLKEWAGKPGGWSTHFLDAFSLTNDEGKTVNYVPGILKSLGVLLATFALGNAVLGRSILRFVVAFLPLAFLATLSYALAAQSVAKHYNLEFALWALAVGLIISNTIGTPRFLKEAVRTEFYIKTGLVLLGAEVLLSKLLVLGVPGIFVAWVVTPIVLISTYAFGQKVLKIESRSLNMVISADMSVCGVSAAIATAAACKAKKEELSFAIGLSLMFTVVMMVVMPWVIRGLGMSPVLGGAWMGGTIDSTGAVAAAGAILGDEALNVATTVKMIQNVLIGVTAFCVAVYWVTYVEKHETAERTGLSEIWIRFPKFVLGFLLASILFSVLDARGPEGATWAKETTAITKTWRGWCFCLAFVSIGLETNFRQLSQYLKGGKPLVLYLCGQTLNLILTLTMAWLMFEVIFKDAVTKVLQK